MNCKNILVVIALMHLSPDYLEWSSDRSSISNEILKPIVVPYSAAIADNFILIDDKCRPHRTNLDLNIVCFGQSK